MIVVAPACTIRILTPGEFPLCLPYGERFHQEMDVPGLFSPETFLTKWGQFYTLDLGAIFGLWRGDELIGGLGGVAVPDLTTGQLIASELFWYVREDSRYGTWPIRLVKTFQHWGRDRGAVRFRMVHLLRHDEDPSTVKLASVYRHLGLRPIEVAYDGPIGGALWQ